MKRHNSDYYDALSVSLFEAANDGLLNRLNDNVDTLQQMTVEIGNDIKRDNGLLDNIDDEMDHSVNYFQRLLQQQKTMIQKPFYAMCYIVPFIVIITFTARFLMML